MLNKKLLIAVFSILSSVGLIAQDSLRVFNELSWTFDLERLQNQASLFPAISFDGASQQATLQDAPMFYRKIEMEQTTGNAEVLLQNEIYTSFDLSVYPEINTTKFETEIKFDYYLSVSRNQSAVNVLFSPVMYDKKENKLLLLKSFDLVVIPGEETNPYQHFDEVAENSVLATGDWYKFRLSKTGIYKISYDKLKGMGLDAGSLDPRNLRIYGNGAGMLPEGNDISVPDDLQENSIYVHGEEDGSFDSGDYILFYGQEPTVWNYMPIDNGFHHTHNVYTDYTYYFITASIGPGKRVESADNSSLIANKTVTEIDDYWFHHVDEVNLVGTGRKWFENLSDDSYFLNTTLTNLVISEPVYIRTNVVARSFSSSHFEVLNNDVKLGSVVIGPVVEGSLNAYAIEKTFEASYVPNSQNISLNVDYISTATSSVGWLDYLELNFKRSLSLRNNQMNFRNVASVEEGSVSEFSIGNVSAGLKVWDVSSPFEIKQITGTYNSSVYSIKSTTETLKEFACFNGSSYYGVEFVEKVTNQNLHGIETPEMVIVTYPGFYDEAQVLADFHRSADGMQVELCTTKEIYNEFSSGKQDIGAIRNMMRMLYNRSDAETFKYLLLFGDASYDYKNRIVDNTNYVPSWESTSSLDLISSYVTDDFFGLLDFTEGYENLGSLDIGIGRFPVGSSAQAAKMVKKTIHYATNSDEVMNTWRNYVCFVADDEDGNLHVRQTEEMAEYVEENVKNLNIDKIYFDAYTQVSTPSGQRYPEVEEQINNRVDKGALIINYTGHGGETGWAHEQVLSISDINNWTNYENLPVFITATCEFSRYDDPSRTSAGEYVFLNPDGGAIALFTTSRATYAGSNLSLNKKFYSNAFTKIDGEYPSMGDIIRMSKSAVATGINKRKYVLLGDPALKLAYPKDSIVLAKINGVEVTEVPDTLKALAEVSISGSVYSCEGYKLDDFNGTVFTSVFDKETKLTTLGQDEESTPRTFYLRKNIVYKGKTPATNGDFEFTFIVPKDIAYNFGYGRMSFYAKDENLDASGYFENYIVGGYNDTILPDTEGPLIDLFINEASFKRGGITDQNPRLLAYVEDVSGINTVGNGIGHDIVAVIDRENDNPFILNDYYEADLGSFKSGAITYPFFNLAEGQHTLYIKVWDVFNNSSEKTIDFEVVKSSDFVVEELMNFPNPFIEKTSFVFQHNQAGETLDVELMVFSVIGKLECVINRTIQSTGFVSPEIEWNGKNHNGQRLSNGFYIYKLIVTDEAGNRAGQDGKMILTGY
jgi:Peptidase family C25